jgi:S-DNA-T family DNA segregation ATPase FtsK/SpoIIIE
LAKRTSSPSCSLPGPRYGSLDPTALASQLGAYGISTRQVWGKTADGKKANRRGVSRADVLAVISSSQAARSSGSASEGVRRDLGTSL